MTWYLRKAVRLGPLRLNLSKSGLGASVGVPGARFGVDASGHPYTHLGRGGLYYRKRGPRPSPRSEGPAIVAPEPPPEERPPAATHGRIGWGWLLGVVLITLAVAKLLG